MALVVRRADGGVSVLRLGEGSDLAAELAKWQTSADPSWLPIVGSVEVADPPLPADRYFRNAWQADAAGAITVHLPRARLIRLRQLKEIRDRRLEVVTRLLEKAQDDGAGAAVISNLRQNRRDLRALDDTLPGQLDAISDPAVLKDYTPPELA